MKPRAYVEGVVEFYGCLIETTPAALIPRQESEILVDLIVKKKLSPGRLLDLCTGTGCLGLSLKKAYPEMEVILSDISEDALALAQRNAKTNALSVEIVQGDFLSSVEKFSPFNYVVCNPPYVSEAEYVTLDSSVKDYEPRLALVGGEDGLFFYRKLAKELPPLLAPGAEIFLEIGGAQGESVKEIFMDASWAEVKILPDWAGWDRFCFAKFLYC